ncbi:hypothetical protein GCM10022295_27400 [Streptomyces osmaniensis]|uniref:Tc toxin complex TcA C-terminal TcB-binding domain-containing protein n=1 Tax=Streptomyces osmaniensis TaxID=593134 RepID=A0ABP6W4E2_9ACTN
MEVAYLDQHRREFELTRQVSLSQLDAAALIRLKVTATCEVEIPDGFFDLDCAGYYAGASSPSRSAPSVWPGATPA